MVYYRMRTILSMRENVHVYMYMHFRCVKMSMYICICTLVIIYYIMVSCCRVPLSYYFENCNVACHVSMSMSCQCYVSSMLLSCSLTGPSDNFLDNESKFSLSFIMILCPIRILIKVKHQPYQCVLLAGVITTAYF